MLDYLFAVELERREGRGEKGKVREEGEGRSSVGKERERSGKEREGNSILVEKALVYFQPSFIVYTHTKLLLHCNYTMHIRSKDLVICLHNYHKRVRYQHESINLSYDRQQSRSFVRTTILATHMSIIRQRIKEI